MAQFNLNDYETVAERLKRLHADHPYARVITYNETTLQDRQVSTWVVRAEIWLPMYEIWEDAPAPQDPENGWFLKATGYAFEVDGGKGPNATSALENAETSSIGRALGNMNYVGDKRASREEMSKANAGVTPPATSSRDWIKESEAVMSYAEMKKLWAKANAANASKQILDEIAARGTKLKTDEENAG